MEDPILLPCADKMSFNTKSEAKATATTLTYQNGTKLYPYKCQHCGLWHLSSSH